MVILGWVATTLPLTQAIQAAFVISAAMLIGFVFISLASLTLMIFAFLMGIEMAGLVGLYSVAA